MSIEYNTDEGGNARESEYSIINTPKSGGICLDIGVCKPSAHEIDLAQQHGTSVCVFCSSCIKDGTEENIGS